MKVIDKRKEKQANDWRKVIRGENDERIQSRER